jgi:hypothetical protein
MDFRTRVGDERFVDVSFADLQTDPVGTVANGYQRLGLDFTAEARRGVAEWARGHEPGSRGQHSYELADYGLTADGVRERFTEYLSTYDASA